MSHTARYLIVFTALMGIVLGLGGCDSARRGLAGVMGLPTDENVLFWSVEQRDKAFSQMERLITTATVEASADNVFELESGHPLQLAWQYDGRDWDIGSYMADQRAAGVLVLHDGKIRLEEYAMGYSNEGRWTSFSVAKSFTSTLVGAAIQDGFIESIDAPLIRYIPQLKGSGYDGVTVKQLLTMTSGVRWNEDYEDPESDVARFNQVVAREGEDPVVLYMKTLEREAPPGTRWQYNTGETNLIGVLVANATGKGLAQYLSEKVWQPYGMERDAAWILNDGGREIGGCCLSVSLRDYARFGQFALAGGRIGTDGVVPDGWFEAAGRKQTGIGAPGHGYGYQWWTYDDGSYAAQGIFGQGVFVDPRRNLVIATSGNWTRATDDVMKDRRNAFYRAVQAELDTQ